MKIQNSGGRSQEARKKDPEVRRQASGCKEPVVREAGKRFQKS
jgi:hypothetical protein